MTMNQPMMNDAEEKEKRIDDTLMPDDQTFQQRLQNRHRAGAAWQVFYFSSIVIALIALITLFTDVIDGAFGSIAVQYKITPAELAGEGREFSELNEEELAQILVDNGVNFPVLIRDTLSEVPSSEYTASTLAQVTPDGNYPEGYENTTIDEIRSLNPEERDAIFVEFLRLNLTRGELENIVLEEVAEQQVLDAWTLGDAIWNWEPTSAEQSRFDELPSLIEAAENQIATLEEEIADLEQQVQALRDEGAAENRDQIREINSQINERRSQIDVLADEIEDLENERSVLINENITLAMEFRYTEAEAIRFYSWIDTSFLTTPMSSTPANAGIRTALIGSIYIMFIVVIFSLPIGVGAAIYLEEYATDNFLNNFIETNVRNLAGVPSIIYGLLGLAILVRALAPVTTGMVFGIDRVVADPNRVVTSIESALSIDLELNDGVVTLAEETSTVTEEQAQALFDTFERYGSFGFSNLYGTIGLDRAMREVRDALDLDGNIDTSGYTTPNGIEPRTIDVNFDEESLTFDQYRRLVVNLTSIAEFSVVGRTLISAGLTLGLLILPIIIISAQEAIRAVAFAQREASYGLGATKWQTIWKVVIPSAIPGILTGAIIAVSRAVGETAPLIVVGASTFLLKDPTLFSGFTVLPIQIYNWTTRPQGQFEFIAAAAIIVLLILTISLNSIAIVLRNYYSVER